MVKYILASLLFLYGATAFSKEIVKIEVTEKGFMPSVINVKPGTEVVLEVTRKTDQTCSTEIQVPTKKINEKLPLNKAVIIFLGKLEKGEIRFGCGMNMMDGGKIFVH